MLINYQAPYEAESITGRIVYPGRGFDSTVPFLLCLQESPILLLRTGIEVKGPDAERAGHVF